MSRISPTRQAITVPECRPSANDGSTKISFTMFIHLQVSNRAQHNIRKDLIQR